MNEEASLRCEAVKEAVDKYKDKIIDTAWHFHGRMLPVDVIKTLLATAFMDGFRAGLDHD